MSEHKITQDNIDIDVDVSTTDVENNEADTSSTDTREAATTDAKDTDLDDSTLTDTDNKKANDDQDESYLPLLALRDVVVYPHMQIALFVGRAPSVKAVELAQAEYGNKVLVVAQKDSLTEDIDQDNLYQYGTV